MVNRTAHRLAAFEPGGGGDDTTHRLAASESGGGGDVTHRLAASEPCGGSNSHGTAWLGRDVSLVPEKALPTG
jgi:hypothetical protein